MPPALIVTGSSGIAEATALLAAERGWRVFIAGLDESQCADLAARVNGACLACDLREEVSADRVCEHALAAFGQIDALFNVAGVSGRRYGDGPAHECTLEGWRETMTHNAQSLFLMSRAVVRIWLERKLPGAIVNMASVLALSPEPEHFATHAYAASKGAILTLTKSMAAYYAPHRIRVNAIAPGLVSTPMSARAQSDEAVLSLIEHKQPLTAGMLDAAHVAQAALFLLGEESVTITGQVLAVDGGWSVTN